MKIRLYTSPNCPHCLTVKAFLNDQKISYEELDAYDYSKLLIEKAVFSLPVLQIGNEFYSCPTQEHVFTILKEKGFV
jgi:glutaredoxin